MKTQICSIILVLFTNQTFAAVYPLSVTSPDRINEILQALPGLNEGFKKDLGYYKRQVKNTRIQLAGQTEKSGCRYNFKVNYDFEGGIHVQEEGSVVDSRRKCLPGTIVR